MTPTEIAFFWVGMAGGIIGGWLSALVFFFIGWQAAKKDEELARKEGKP